MVYFRVPGIPDERKDFNLFNYHKLKDIDRYLTVVEKAFPDLVKVASIGTTYEGRSIKIITVSNAKAGNDFIYNFILIIFKCNFSQKIQTRHSNGLWNSCPRMDQPSFLLVCY